jgi:hypothetical protein
MPTIAITKTTGWLNNIRNGFAGSDNPKITYIAVGSGTTPPSSADTQLAVETFRKAVTTYSVGGDGELFVSMFLGPSDLVGGDIEEVGLFAGNSATNTPNSGILIGRGLWNHSPKSGSESITLTLDATVS